MPIPEKGPKSKIKIWLIVVIVIAAAAAASAGYYGSQYYRIDTELQNLNKAYSLLADANANSNGNENGESADENANENANAAEGFGASADAEGYVNEDYGYKLKRPRGSVVTYASDADANAAGLHSGKVCTTVTWDEGFVIIYAAQNMDAYLICGPTGIGAEYQPLSETLTIAGQSLTAEGFYKSIDAQGSYEDIMTVYPYPGVDDRYRITYGVNKFNPQATGVSIDAVKQTVKDVVETFEKI